MIQIKYRNKRTAYDAFSVTKTLDGSNKHMENNSKYMTVSRELVSRPGEYKQGARHHNKELGMGLYNHQESGKLKKNRT